MSITVVVGNPRAHSRTSAAARTAARAVAAEVGTAGEADVIELAELAPVLLQPGERHPDAAHALERVLAARVLVVASPTYKATYTGLLKVFLDQIGTGGLAGTVALPLLVVGSPAHTLAVEVHLRPLLVELGALVPSPGLALPESDLPRVAAIAEEWAAAVAPAVRTALHQGAITR
ncbi:FMN reductase [Murinocardiopsis flavida]|uniref:FMN reductase n=1 Tax=Murinocardiopsis flavida TaxID=645275 RepID=A0A2P8CXD7_9ACTN|nr:NAD(P)H-dependent oxidoreductase [Murinocardiopsis flavida]PSK89643.1 FMN reductase [Murinocardiopsis flavida]